MLDSMPEGILTIEKLVVNRLCAIVKTVNEGIDVTIFQSTTPENCICSEGFM